MESRPGETNNGASSASNFLGRFRFATRKIKSLKRKPSRVLPNQHNSDISLVALKNGTTKKQSSYIERLPTELRMQIFEHAFQDYEDSLISPFDYLPFTYPPSAQRKGEYWKVPIPALERALVGLPVLYREFLGIRLEKSVFVVVVMPEMVGLPYLDFQKSVSPFVRGGIKNLIFIAGDMSIPFLPSVKASLDSMLIPEPNPSQYPGKPKVESLLMPELLRLVILFPFPSNMAIGNQITHLLDLPRYWTYLGESLCRLIWNYSMENDGAYPRYWRARLQGHFEAMELQFGDGEPILTAQRLQRVHSLAPLLPRIHSGVGLLGPFKTATLAGRRRLFAVGRLVVARRARVFPGGTVWQCDAGQLKGLITRWLRAYSSPNTASRFPLVDGDLLNHVLEPLLQHLVGERQWGLDSR